MTLDDILTISGKPGLYALKVRTRTGFVVESLSDGKRTTVMSARNDVSLLSEISIYTLKEEVPLRSVFRKIKQKENGSKTTISHKEVPEKLKAYFFEIIPDYDEDKVYPSHIKKIIQWYNILTDQEIDFDTEEDTKEDTSQ